MREMVDSVISDAYGMAQPMTTSREANDFYLRTCCTKIILNSNRNYFATNEPISSDGNIEYAVEMYSAPNIQCTQTIDESNPTEKRQLENAPPMDYGVCYSIC